MWKSSDSSVAPVSATGVVTAKGAGSATITASVQAASGMSTVTVTPVLLSSTITTCGNILTPGNYQLAADISQPPSFGPCVEVRTAGVQLDCRQHVISIIQLLGANDVTITNCARGTLVDEQKSTNVTITHNTLLSLTLLGGSGNQVLENTIDGGYDGSGRQVGQDDGILLIDEANDTVQRNTIQNVFDAGIEGVDAVTDSTITDNTIVNAGVAGIASYWCTSWTGNTISGNSVSTSNWLADFIYEVGLGKCVNLSTPGAFENNRLIGNRFTNALAHGGSMNFNLANLPAGAVVGNLIQGNDLGVLGGPFVDPASGFSDGGGNICAPGTSPFCGGQARPSELVGTRSARVRLGRFPAQPSTPNGPLVANVETRRRAPKR
jgi:parallel beta-helix repeat protein